MNLDDNKITKSYHWYLLQSKFKQEKKAAQELRQQDIIVFLPLYRRKKIIKGQELIKEEPLFSRYLFARLNIKKTNWTSIRSTRGITNFVEFGNGPVIVSEVIVNELKKINSLPPEPRLKIGEKVKVIGGSLKGLNAIYQAPNGESRAYILLTFLQQSQRLSINSEFLEPA